MLLSGARVLITGASGLLGTAIARELDGAGAELVLHGYCHKHVLDEEFGARHATLSADLRQPEQAYDLIERAVAIAGRIDALVHCPGDFLRRPLSEISPAEFEAIVDSNLHQAYRVCHYCLPHRPRRLLLLGYAGAEQIRAKPSILPYHISKLGVVLLAKSMAQQGAEWGLLANCISPSACAGAEYQLPEPESDMPLGRPAYPEEIAEAARFLLASDYISGQNLEISAGWQGA